MRTVWKYPLPMSTGLASGEAVWVPVGGVVLHAAMQYGNVTLWIEVDTDAPRVSRRFCIVGTGFEIPPRADRYIGTIFVDSFVFHVYELEVFDA